MVKTTLRLLIREYVKDKFLPPLYAHTEELGAFWALINKNSLTFVNISSSRGLTSNEAVLIGKMTLTALFRETKGATTALYRYKNPLDVAGRKIGLDTTIGIGQLNPALLKDPNIKDAAEMAGIDSADELALDDNLNSLIVMYTLLCNNFKEAKKISDNLNYKVSISFAGYNGSPAIIRDYYDVGLRKEDGDIRAVYLKKTDPADGKIKLYDPVTSTFYDIDENKKLKDYIPAFEAQDLVSLGVRMINNKYANSKEYAKSCIVILNELYPGSVPP